MFAHAVAAALDGEPGRRAFERFDRGGWNHEVVNRYAYIQLGKVGGGSQRWLNLGFMTLQPSELMKPGIVLVLARFYDALPPALTKSWRGLIPIPLSATVTRTSLRLMR